MRIKIYQTPVRFDLVDFPTLQLVPEVGLRDEPDQSIIAYVTIKGADLTWPAGATKLRLFVHPKDSIIPRTLGTLDGPTDEQTFDLGSSPEELLRRIRYAWIDADGKLGPTSKFIEFTQPASVKFDPDNPVEQVTWVSSPVLQPANTDDPFAIGTGVVIVPGTVSGPVVGDVVYQIVSFTENSGAWETEQLEVWSTIPESISGRYLAVKGIATNAAGQQIVDYSARSFIAVPEVIQPPAIDNWEIVRVVGTPTNATPVISIPSAFPYDRLEVSMSDPSVPPETVDANAELLIPVDAIGQSSDPLPRENPDEFRIDVTTARASLAPAGTTWYQSWMFKKLPDAPNLTRQQQDEVRRSSIRVRGVYGGVKGPWSVMKGFDFPVPTIPETPDDPEDEAIRMFLYRTQGQHAGPASIPELYTEGWYGGDYYQWYIGFAISADGQTIITVHDMNGFLMSTDGGKTMFRPEAHGLPSISNVSVWIAPWDKNRVWILAGAVYDRGWGKGNFTGVYESTDGCKTFRQIRYISDIGDNKTIGFHMDNVGGSGGRMYVAAPRYLNGRINGEFVYSNNNGASWSTPVALAAGTFGRIHGIKCHPTDVNTVYMATQTGLWRTTNAGAGWARVPGFPAAETRGLWVDPDNGNHIIATSSISSGGVYETFNAGGSWSRIRAMYAGHLGVGAKDAQGRRTLYVHTMGVIGGSPHIRLLDGTWITRDTSPSRITWDNKGGTGWGFNQFASWHNAGMLLSFFVPSPVDPLACFAQGIVTFARTTNGGKHWELAGAGTGGLLPRGGIHFSRTNPATMAIGFHDAGPARSFQYGDYTTIGSFGILNNPGRTPKDIQTTVRGGQVVNLDYNSYTAAVLLPDDASVNNVAARGRLIGNIGTVWQGMIFIQNKNESGIRQLTGDAAVSRSRTTAGYIQKSPDMCWVGNSRSYNGGDSFVAVPGSWSIITDFDDGTNGVWGHNGNNLGRSANFGDAWTTVYTGNQMTVDGYFKGDVNPVHTDRVIVRNGKTRVHMLHWNGSSISTTVLPDFIPQFYPNGIPGWYNIVDMIWDPRDYRYFYVSIVATGGGKAIFRGQFDANYNFVGWTDVTSVISTQTDQYILHTCWATGDILVSTHANGTFVLAAASDYNPIVGMFAFSGQPAAGSTITLHGQVFTFVSGTAGANQIQIGANLAATLTNARNTLNALTSGNASLALYRVNGNSLEVYLKNPPFDTDLNYALASSGASVSRIRHFGVMRYRGFHHNQPKPVYRG